MTLLLQYNTIKTICNALKVDRLIESETGVEVTIRHCFPKVWEVLPDSEGRGQYFPNWGETISIVIPQLEMHACDWLKSRHVAVSESTLLYLIAIRKKI